MIAASGPLMAMQYDNDFDYRMATETKNEDDDEMDEVMALRLELAGLRAHLANVEHENTYLRARVDVLQHERDGAEHQKMLMAELHAMEKQRWQQAFGEPLGVEGKSQLYGEVVIYRQLMKEFAEFDDSETKKQSKKIVKTMHDSERRKWREIDQIFDQLIQSQRNIRSYASRMGEIYEKATDPVDEEDNLASEKEDVDALLLHNTRQEFHHFPDTTMHSQNSMGNKFTLVDAKEAEGEFVANSDKHTDKSMPVVSPGAGEAALANLRGRWQQNHWQPSVDFA